MSLKYSSRSAPVSTVHWFFTELLSGSNGQRTHLSRRRRADDVEIIFIIWGECIVSQESRI